MKKGGGRMNDSEKRLMKHIIETLICGILVMLIVFAVVFILIILLNLKECNFEGIYLLRSSPMVIFSILLLISSSLEIWKRINNMSS
ncbi:hypothetical protein HYT26_00990 [Candidatus Pacearchaeota archaeon]|nr:hypothetical protein [Candidatus Pacearchaeota archaeon]